MAEGHEQTLRTLAVSHGFSVLADDGRLGEIETPLFPPDSAEPDYLVVLIGRRTSRRRLVGVGLVDSADPRRREVRLRGSRAEIHSLPALLPVAPYVP